MGKIEKDEFFLKNLFSNNARLRARGHRIRNERILILIF